MVSLSVRVVRLVSLEKELSGASYCVLSLVGVSSPGEAHRCVSSWCFQ